MQMWWTPGVQGISLPSDVLACSIRALDRADRQSACRTPTWPPVVGLGECGVWSVCSEWSVPIGAGVL